MAAQTAVSERMTIAFPGMLADSGRDKHVESYVSEESSAEIPFGVMVAQGTADNGALLLHTSAAAMASALAGIVVHSHAYAKDTELGDIGLKPKVTVGVLKRGRVYVLPEEPVSPGDPVRVRAVAGQGEQAGAFLTGADSTDCVDISDFARWVTSGSSSVPAVLEIDMTNAALAAADQ